MNPKKHIDNLSMAEHYRNYITVHPKGPHSALGELALPDGPYHHQYKTHYPKKVSNETALFLFEFEDDSYLLTAIILNKADRSVAVDACVMPDKVSGTLNLLTNFVQLGGELEPEEELILRLYESLIAQESTNG